MNRTVPQSNCNLDSFCIVRTDAYMLCTWGYYVMNYSWLCCSVLFSCRKSICDLKKGGHSCEWKTRMW